MNLLTPQRRAHYQDKGCSIPSWSFLPGLGSLTYPPQPSYRSVVAYTIKNNFQRLMNNLQNERQLSAKFLQFFSFIPLLIGLFFLLLGGQMSSLDCRRVAPKEGHCELTRMYLLWRSSQRWQLSDIQSIDIINQKKQLRLQTSGGEIQLMPYYAGLGRTGVSYQQNRVSWMTRFFTNDQESVLTIREDMRVVNVPVGIGFILIGLAALVEAHRKTLKPNR